MKTFDQLFIELESRARELPAASRSTELLQAGVHEIGKKIVEEAAEVWMAAEHETKEQLALEASQLIYHLQLMLVARGVSLADIEARL
jgi:phosphoribosyl-ATP pyrophosphohydrolase